MSNDGIVNIHGKQYMTVARRVELAHEGANLVSITTEVLEHNPVVIKATVTFKTSTFTGISSANPLKSIEKSNPYEVAETSAVGRALGFAGYGIIEGIASADEMVKASNVTTNVDRPELEEEVDESRFCNTHGEDMVRGFSKTKNKYYYSHRSEMGEICFGAGYKD